jgi:hypothetical protein
VRGLTTSPILGGDGNREFLILLENDPDRSERPLLSRAAGEGPGEGANR